MHRMRIPTSGIASGDSFNIFQATVAMCSIFMGFIFAALLQILSSSVAFSSIQKVTIYILVFAKVFLLIALLCFHHTANQVVRYWNIFFPISLARNIGSILMVLGILAMLLSTATMLYSKEFTVLSILVGIVALGLIPYSMKLGRIHENASYARIVDKKAEPK